MKPKVYIRKARSFGEVFGDTTGYIKQNFKSLFGSILLLVSPFVLLATILITYLFKSAFANMGIDPFTAYTNVGSIMLLMVMLYLLGFTAFITVLNQHMILNDKLPNNERVEIKDIVRTFFGAFLRGLGSMFIMLILSILIGIVLALVFALFAMFIKISPFVGILLFILLYMFLLMIITPMSLYYYTAILFTAQRHKMGVFTALGKVRRSLKGNFWITWAVSFLSGMITNFLTGIAFIPSYIIFIISFITSTRRVAMDPGGANPGFEVPLYMIIIFCITGVLMVCIGSIYFIMMNLQCASLEEKNEGLSIMEKIEGI